MTTMNTYNNDGLPQNCQRIYLCEDSNRKVMLVERLYGSGKRYFVKVNKGLPLFESNDKGEANRFYNLEAAKCDIKWGSFKTSYNI